MKLAILLPLLALGLISGTALADDSKTEKTVEQNTSTNPLTGTQTTTRKYKKKAKAPSGTAEETVTEKDKLYKDGSTSTEKTYEKNSDTNK